MLSRKVCLVTLFLWACFPSDSFAVKKVICVKKNGETAVRERKCAKSEKVLLKKADVGSVVQVTPIAGPKGAPGPMGPQGPKGPAGNPNTSKGFAGDRGEVGPVGPVGEVGANGQSHYDPLKSGQGAFGIIGGDYDANGGTGFTCSTYFFPFTVKPGDIKKIVFKKIDAVINRYCSNRSSFPRYDESCCKPARSSQPFDPAQCYDDTQIENQSLCTGTAQNPTAPPGVVCFYPTYVENAHTLNSQFLFSNNGFKICWNFDFKIGATLVKGVWAYTAP